MFFVGRRLCVFVGLLVAVSAIVGGGHAAELSGRDIAWKVYRADTSKDATRNIIMVVERRGIRLVRELEMITKKFPLSERSLIRFLAPPDVKNNRYLTWSWEDPERSNDMWIFMPSENLVRRISAGGKKSAFMRSDWANEDMEKRSVLADQETLLREEVVDGILCYVVEYIPNNDDDTNYSKRIAWIRSDIWNPVRIEYYDKRKKLLKVAYYGGYEKIDNIWAYRKVVIETPRRDSRTLMDVQSTRFNQGFPDSDFEKGSLKR